VLGGDRSWEKGPIRSPQVESGRRDHLVELVEEAAARVSPKVAMAMAVGDGRSGKAATTAMQIARGARERERRASEGWAGSV
jgi:hypothetical protein